ncbi:MAG: hypothetical protein Q4D79_04730 [Propionibacteriaceae bacterium]|nr:hypothetical protein [Propionibacteriaceae bacterium]
MRWAFIFWAMLGLGLAMTSLSLLALGAVGIGGGLGVIGLAAYVTKGRGTWGVLAGVGVFLLWVASQGVACPSGQCQVMSGSLLALVMGLAGIILGVGIQIFVLRCIAATT